MKELSGKLHRLQRIGVAIDAHAGIESALHFAWHIAQQTGASIEVVHVEDELFGGYMPFAPDLPPAFQDSVQLTLDIFVREALDMLGVRFDLHRAGEGSEAAGVPAVSTRVLTGAPAGTLAAYAESVDLLVLNTTDRSILEQKLFGAVSVSVAKHAHAPVLLIPPDAVFRGFKNVLYASNSESLIPSGIFDTIAFARQFDSQLHFVHVGSEHEKEAVRERALFETIYTEAQLEQPFIFSKMLSGNVTKALYEYAFYHRIELLVFMTHQRSFWENLLHHSVTGQAAVNSEVPLLIIHSDSDLSQEDA